MKIDAHVHIYETINGYGGRGELRPIGDGYARWANGDTVQLIPEGMGDTGFRTETLIRLLDQNHISKAIVLQGNLYGFQNEYILESIQKYPDRLYGACAVDPFALHAAELLQRLLEKGYVAAKFECSDNCGLMSFHPRFAIDGERMEIMYEIIESAGAALVLDIGSRGMNSYQPEAVARIAQKHPRLRIIICHLMAHKKNEQNYLTEELQLLRMPNIWFDISAVPWNIMPAPYPFKEALQYIKEAKKILGSEKLIWGSDAPGVAIYDSYDKLYSYLDGELTDEEEERIFWKNAADAYCLQL